MVEKTTYCDRCGKDVYKNGNCLSNNGFHILMRRKFSIMKYKGNPDHCWEEADLCQDCYDSLRDWMKEGKKNDKADN